MCHVQLTIWTPNRRNNDVLALVTKFVRDYATDEYNIRIVTDSTQVKPSYKIEFMEVTV